MKRARRRRGRLALGGVAVVLVAAGAWWAVAGFGGDDGSWVEVDRGDLMLEVDVTGKLRAVVTDQIEPPKISDMWQFKIAFMAPEGEDVVAGEPVIAFDASELEQRLQQELAERDAAEKRVEKAEREAEAAAAADELARAEAAARLGKARLKVERPAEVVAAREQALERLDLELAEKEVGFLDQRLEAHGRAGAAYLESLRSQLARAEQRVAETRESIGKMEQRAPRAGTVVYVTDWQEQKKSVGDTTWRGESVIELPDLSRMKAMGQVHEADAGRLADGQPVRLRLDAHPDIEFRGHIAQIWKTVERESHKSPLKVVNIEIALDQTDTRRMRPGMRFRGQIEVEQVLGALLVPSQAVFLDRGGPVVYRRGWLGRERVPVELGRRDADEVEVLSGLAEGDVVSAVDPRQRGEA